MKVTAHQLKELDPKQFEKEYWRWTEGANDWEWRDYVEEEFREDCKPLGIEVRRIYFDTYPWHATFDGYVDVSTWMKHCKLDEKWYPLWLALDAEKAGASVDAKHHRSVGLNIEWRENTPYSMPMGIFADMPEDDWADMLEKMWVEADLETELKEFLGGLCIDLARKLEKAYDHETSEEAFLDSCEANEVTFDYEGDEDAIQS